MTNPIGPFRQRAAGNARKHARCASALAVIVLAALFVACSKNSGEPTSQPSPGSASTSATLETPSGGSPASLMVNGHTHTFSGPVDCSATSANPKATPPQGEREVTASDDVASFDIRWANATPSLVALSLTFKVDDGEYSMPYYPNPPHVEATKEGKNYTVKGTPPVLAPGDSATSNLQVEIHATCP